MKKNHRERGATLVDYALLVGLISAVTFVSVRTLGRTVACIMGGMAYGFSRPDRSPEELRRSVPASYVSGADYIACGALY